MVFEPLPSGAVQEAQRFANMISSATYTVTGLNHQQLDIKQRKHGALSDTQIKISQAQL
jgi:hypothetical protein